jgi:hypothetical protein
MDDKGYTHTDSPLTTYELIKQLEIIAKTSRNMDMLISYMLADIEFKKNRSLLFEKLSGFLTGTIIIGAVGKLGSVVIGFIAPFAIQKIKMFILGL